MFGVIVDNNPKIPKPALGITGEGPNPVPALVKSAKTLETAGADFIVIPCNSAHYFLEAISASVNIPIISIITETVEAARRKKCKKIGILATSGLINSRIYQNGFLDAGIESLCPNGHEQKQLMDNIIRFKDSGEKKGLTSIVNSLVDTLCVCGADGIVLGCTEIPVVFSPPDHTMPFFNTIEILALGAIRAAKGIP